MRMTTEEAFVKVLQMHGIEHAFGIIGSAFMPISDLFPEGRHHLLGRGARDQRRPDLRRLHALDRQDGDGHRPERAGRHRLRHRGQDRLLEPHAHAAGDAAGGQPHHRPGRLPGSRADGAVPRHGLLPGGGARSRPHRRGAEPRDRQGQAAVGAGADQHPARLLDPGDRHHPAGHRRVRATGGRRQGRSPRRPSCSRRPSSR